MVTMDHDHNTGLTPQPSLHGALVLRPGSSRSEETSVTQRHAQQGTGESPCSPALTRFPSLPNAPSSSETTLPDELPNPAIPKSRIRTFLGGFKKKVNERFSRPRNRPSVEPYEPDELTEPQDLDEPQGLTEPEELAEPAEEPRRIDDHLIRNLSLSSTPSEQEEAIQHFMKRIMSHRCPNPSCRINAMDGNGKFVFRHAARIIAPIQDSSRRRTFSTATMTEDASHVRCPNCLVTSCPCCLQVLKGSRVFPVAESSRAGGKIGWCCDGGRIFYMFALLCGPMAHPDDRKASLYQHQQVQGAHAKANSSGGEKSSGSAGTGYSKRASKPFQRSNTSQWRDAQVPLKEKLAESDESLVLVLDALIRAWPSASNDTSFDQAPPQLLLTIVRRSPLMIKVAELLRDDCMGNVLNRRQLYTKIVDFLEMLSSHPFSEQLVKGTRVNYPLDKTILRIAFGPKVEIPNAAAAATAGDAVDIKGRGKGKGKGTKPELETEMADGDAHQSLISLASNLSKQAESVMQHYKRDQSRRTQQPEDVREIMALCKRICCVAKMGQARPAAVVASSSAAGPSRTALDVVPDPVREMGEPRDLTPGEWLAGNKVAMIENVDWKSQYAYTGKLVNSASRIGAPGRTKRLVCELSELGTSLPEGIYVRHDDTRLDAMKVLIAGPEDTPYENGLWEFDLYCPPEYPNVPPEVTCKTVVPQGFNPNLYNDGKVCLSLLGTWSGEAWVAKQSTLLQLLVSMQSMIFCAEPWGNEPGQAKNVGTAISDNYNARVRADTVATAMAAWIVRNRSPVAGYVWGDVVAKHFEHKAKKILLALKAWNGKMQPTPADSLKLLKEYLRE